MAVPQNLLQRFRLVNGFTDADLGIIAQICRLRDVPQGMSIFLQGSTGEGLFLLESGQVEIILGAPERPQLLCVIEGGDQLGELALLRAAPRQVAAKARTPCRLIEIKRSDFNELMKQKPQACMKLMLNLFAEMERRFAASVPYLV